MGKIRLLEENVSNKIAAGEVVEKPASIVKELVENSIDANSTTITIEIKNGGKSFIRVTDNGNGIEEDDTVIAFERHATSKIHDAEDLDKISTLGFRGEALASIAAVSQVELITKAENSIVGTIIEVHGGKVIKKEEIGCPKGTTIIVRNIFFNTPARLKFLKSDSAESAAISNYVEKLALTHPEISFKLISNNASILHTAGNNDILTTILNVFGKEFASAMLPLNFQKDNIRIYGYIGKPEISRSNRNYQCIYINERYIKNKIISSAIDDAYKTFVMVNKYPSAVIYLELNPSFVDVNVHPAKMEVRFDSDEKIYNIVFEAVSEALKSKTIIPNVSLTSSSQPISPKINEQISKTIEKIELNNVSTYEIKGNKPFERLNESQASYAFEKEQTVNKQEVLEKFEEKDQQNIFTELNYRIIGQVFSTYIIIEVEDNMYLIDQHAAHERFNYNNLSRKYNNNEIMSQELLSPIVLKLKYDEFRVVEDNKELFLKIGYDIEEFGENTYLIRSVPFVLDKNYGRDFFIEVIDKILNKKISGLMDLRENILYSMACKSAIKANERLTDLEIKELINEVIKMKQTLTCPHGRPVIISITKYEIEKMFKRVQ